MVHGTELNNSLPRSSDHGKFPVYLAVYTPPVLLLVHTFVLTRGDARGAIIARFVTSVSRRAGVIFHVQYTPLHFTSYTFDSRL